MALAETLKQAIEDSGLSLYRISQDSGLDYAALHRFANGERDLRLETADILVEYFGLELKPKAKPKARKRKPAKRTGTR